MENKTKKECLNCKKKDKLVYSKEKKVYICQDCIDTYAFIKHIHEKGLN